MRRIINEILGVKWSKKLKNAPLWQWKQSMHKLFWFWASLILFFSFVLSNCMVFWFSICCSLRWIPLLKTWIFQTTWTTFNQHQLVSKHYSWWLSTFELVNSKFSVFMEMKEGSVVFDVPQYPEMMNKLVHQECEFSLFISQTCCYSIPCSLCPGILPLDYKWSVKWLHCLFDYYVYSIVFNEGPKVQCTS